MQNIATVLENVMNKKKGELSAYEHVYVKKNDIVDNLRTFGKIGIVQSSYSKMKSVESLQKCRFV